MATKVEELYALIPAEEAEEAATRLRLRVPEDLLEVRTPEAARYRLLDERLHSDALGAGRGGLLGALLGAVVGVIVAVVVDPAVIVWILIAFGFAALGGMAGGMWGLQRTEPEDDDPAVDVVVDDPEAVRLLVVRAPHERNAARRILEGWSNVRFLEHPEPLPDDEEPAPEDEHVGSEPTHER